MWCCGMKNMATAPTTNTSPTRLIVFKICILQHHFHVCTPTNNTERKKFLYEFPTQYPVGMIKFFWAPEPIWVKPPFYREQKQLEKETSFSFLPGMHVNWQFFTCLVWIFLYRVISYCVLVIDEESFTYRGLCNRFTLLMHVSIMCKTYYVIISISFPLYHCVVWCNTMIFTLLTQVHGTRVLHRSVSKASILYIYNIYGHVRPKSEKSFFNKCHWLIKKYSKYCIKCDAIYTNYYE